LKHTFLVAENNFRSFDFEQTFETVVTYDNTTVEVVKVGCSETATIEGHEGTEFRRDNGNSLEDHPLRAVAMATGAEAFNDLEAFESFGFALLRAVGVGLVTELIAEAIEVELAEEVVDSFCAHFGDEFVGIAVFEGLVFAGEVVNNIVVFLFG
jgi:hypothetical protein